MSTPIVLEPLGSRATKWTPITEMELLWAGAACLVPAGTASGTAATVMCGALNGYRNALCFVSAFIMFCTGGVKGGIGEMEYLDIWIPFPR